MSDYNLNGFKIRLHHKDFSDISLITSFCKMPTNCGMGLFFGVHFVCYSDTGHLSSECKDFLNTKAERSYDLDPLSQRTWAKHVYRNVYPELVDEFLTQIVDKIDMSSVKDRLWIDDMPAFYAGGGPKELTVDMEMRMSSCGKILLTDNICINNGPFLLYEYSKDRPNWSMDPVITSNPNMGHDSKLICLAYNTTLSRNKGKGYTKPYQEEFNKTKISSLEDYIKSNYGK